MPTLHDTIIQPLITEKSSEAFQERSEYTFRVHPDASKPQIKRAVEELFQVRVKGVWTSNFRGKTKRLGRTVGRKAHWKKAIVRLAEGDTIEIFEG